MILRPLFCFKDTKNTGLLMFNSLKQKKIIFVVNRNWKKLTDSCKRAKILADNRKSYHPIETLVKLFLLTCKVEVSTVLHLTWLNYQLMKQNGVATTRALILYIRARNVIAWISSDYFESLLQPELQGNTWSQHLAKFEGERSVKCWGERAGEK